jgi:hypothetical protein
MLGVTTVLVWRRERWQVGRGSWFMVGLILLLALLLGVSWWNTAAEWQRPSGWEGRRVLVPREHFAGLPSTQDRERTVWFGTAWIALLTVAWLLSLVPWSRRERRQFWLWWGFQAGVLAAVGLWFRATGATQMLGFGEAVNPWFFASFRYHNHWVAFALLGLGWLLAWWWSRRHHPWRRNDPRALVAVAIGALFLSLPFSHSRSGMLFAVAWGGLLLWGLARSLGNEEGKSGERPRHQQRRWIVLGGGLAGLIAMVVSAPALEHRWEGTLEQWEAYQQGGTFDIRFGPAPAASLELIGQKPLWGWGAGSYFRAFPSVAGDAFRYETWGRERLARLEFAHCDWLQFPAEIGLGGMSLLLLLLGLALWRAAQAGRFRRLGTGDGWIWLSLATLALFATWDFPLGNFAVASLTAWTLALQAAPSESAGVSDGVVPLASAASPSRARNGR